MCRQNQTSIKKKIDKVNAKLTNLLEYRTKTDKSFPISEVFITFETEAEQNKVLAKLEVPDFLPFISFCLPCSRIPNVCEIGEPGDVLWANRSVTFIYVFFYPISFILIVAILTGSFFAISEVKNIAGVDRTALLVLGLDHILPILFVKLTDMESKGSETTRQKEIQGRLFLGKLLTIVIFPYVLTNWDDTLTADNLTTIRNTQLLTTLVSPLITTINFSGILMRHVFGLLFVYGQDKEQYNSLWKVMNWTITDRYVDATKILSIILFSSFLLPKMMYVGAIAFILQFLLDRYSLLRQWKQMPSLGISLCKVFPKEIMTAVAVHMYVTR